MPRAASNLSKTELRSFAASLDPTSFDEARLYLEAVFQAIKAGAGKYSYARFNEDLGFGNCNTIHMIIKSERPLTVKAALKIIDALGLHSEKRQYFLSLVKAETRRTSGTALKDLVELKAATLPLDLSREHLLFYRDWYHAAILELLALPGAEATPAWLATHLMPAVSPLKAERSLKLLERLGYVAYDEEQKRLVPQQQMIATGPVVHGMAIIRFHHQMIALAQEALTAVPASERDINAITIAVPASLRDEFKGMLQDVMNRMLEAASKAKDADEVLQINTQLFPIGRLQRRKRHAP